MDQDRHSSSPLQYCDLSKQELTDKWREIEDVQALYQMDPVAALEVWKAMHPRSTLPATTGITALNARTKPLRRKVASDPLSPPRGVLDGDSATFESGHRARRASHYPQNMLLKLDGSTDHCSIMELQATLRNVVDETHRFEAEIKRWRSTIDRAGRLPNLDEVTAFHNLEIDLLDAKLEDMNLRVALGTETLQRQQYKAEVLGRHCEKVLGDLFFDEVPPVQTADDLQKAVKTMLADIRDAKYQLDQRRSAQERALNRGHKKVAALEEALAEKQRSALDEARRLHPADEDRAKALAERRDHRLGAIAKNAIESLTRAEGESRTALEDMQMSALKIFKSDFQMGLLVATSSNPNRAPAASVAKHQTFDVPSSALSKGRRRR